MALNKNQEQNFLFRLRKKSLLNFVACIFILNGGNLPMSHAANSHFPLIADPAIIQIPVKENNEPLINIKDLGEIVVGPSPEVPNNYDYTQMRQSVYLKLFEAQKKLPSGLHFCLYEAYRSISLQKTLFEKRYARIKQLHPHWSAKEIFLETTRLVSPVTNLDQSNNVPPHSTGGAIDVYLVDDRGQYVPMGLHPKDWMQDHDGSLSLTASTKINTEEAKNRKIMHDALSSVGFVNYPAEYWHWSYGDRYWAYYTQSAYAMYGSI